MTNTIGRLLLSTILAVSFSAAAYAGGGHGHGHSGGGGYSRADAESYSTAESNAHAGSYAVGAGQINQDLTIDDHSKTNVKPPAIAPNLGGLVATPYTCMGSSQVSVGAAGVVAIGIGTTWRDVECDKREAIKVSAQLGETDLARALLYDLDVVKDLMRRQGTTISQAGHTTSVEEEKKNCVEKYYLLSGKVVECN